MTKRLGLSQRTGFKRDAVVGAQHVHDLVDRQVKDSGIDVDLQSVVDARPKGV
jgi:methylaspartate ammonia-lyase